MRRKTLQDAAVALLESLAVAHPMGHQEKKANRYVLERKDGTTLEIMFEKNEESPPNIWTEDRFLRPFIGSSINCKPSPAALLYAKIGAGGKLLYGRHSSLRNMPRLGMADLIYATPRNLQELGRILDQLMDG